MNTPQTPQQTVDLLSASIGVAPVRLPVERQARLVDMPDGLHRAVPSELYHQRELGIISNSSLKEFSRSPAHHLAWANGERDREDTPALAFGRAFHMAALEPDLFASTYVVQPDFGDCRKKDNKAKRDTWRKDNGYDEINEVFVGKSVITADDHARVVKMRDAVRNHSRAGKLIKAAGESEMTALWTDAMSGLRGRARADYFTHAYATIIDLKTTEDASERSFRRDVANYSYDQQCAIYRDAWTALRIPIRAFIFVAVEKHPPYEVAVYSIDDAWLTEAHSRYRTLVQLMADCKRKNEWPGYPQQIQTLTMPAWMRSVA